MSNFTLPTKRVDIDFTHLTQGQLEDWYNANSGSSKKRRFQLRIIALGACNELKEAINSLAGGNSKEPNKPALVPVTIEEVRDADGAEIIERLPDVDYHGREHIASLKIWELNVFLDNITSQLRYRLETIKRIQQ